MMQKQSVLTAIFSCLVCTLWSSCIYAASRKRPEPTGGRLIRTVTAKRPTPLSQEREPEVQDSTGIVSIESQAGISLLADTETFITNCLSSAAQSADSLHVNENIAHLTSLLQKLDEKFLSPAINSRLKTLLQLAQVREYSRAATPDLLASAQQILNRIGYNPTRARFKKLLHFGSCTIPPIKEITYVQAKKDLDRAMQARLITATSLSETLTDELNENRCVCPDPMSAASTATYIDVDADETETLPTSGESLADYLDTLQAREPEVQVSTGIVPVGSQASRAKPVNTETFITGCIRSSAQSADSLHTPENIAHLTSLLHTLDEKLLPHDMKLRLKTLLQLAQVRAYSRAATPDLLADAQQIFNKISYNPKLACFQRHLKYGFCTIPPIKEITYVEAKRSLERALQARQIAAIPLAQAPEAPHE
jgi:hypothetical protein